MVKERFLPFADVECRTDYPPVSAFGFGCRKFSLFCWTRFGASSGPVAASELPVREAYEPGLGGASTVKERQRWTAAQRGYVDGAQRAVQSAGVASRAVDGQ